MVKKGMGATVQYWSDRKGATVISVSPNQKTIEVQLDKATRTDKNGMSDQQTYKHARDKNGDIYTFTLRRNGQYVRKGDPSWGLTVFVGERRTHHDFSF